MQTKIGSNIPRQVCRTVRQSDEETSARREALEQARERMLAEEFVRIKWRGQ